MCIQHNFQEGETIGKDNLNIKYNQMDGKALIHSKTFWASVAAVATGLGTYFTGEQDLQELVLVIVGAIFGVLRLFTNKPITGVK